MEGVVWAPRLEELVLTSSRRVERAYDVEEADRDSQGKEGSLAEGSHMETWRLAESHWEDSRPGEGSRLGGEDNRHISSTLRFEELPALTGGSVAAQSNCLEEQ